MSAFESLPTEIHLQIFSHLDAYADVLCLSVLDGYFFRLGRGILRGILSSYLSPWAGQNIICIGNETEAGDYPPGLLTAEEDAELAGLGEEGDGEEIPGPVNLFSITKTRYRAAEPLANIPFFPSVEFHYRSTDPTHEPKGPSLATITKSSIDLLPGPERSQASALACLTRKMLFPEDRKWVLRDLTTKEFVSAERVALYPDFVEGPFVKGLGFGEAVLTRICWSSTPKCGIWDSYIGFLDCETGSDWDIGIGPSWDFHRGVWAGHRFDITTEDQASAEDGWKDVGWEVVDDIHALWLLNLGRHALFDVEIRADDTKVWSQ
jgi:hypothetical protein